MNKNIKCFLIDSASNLITMLSMPINYITNSDEKCNLHSSWTTTFIDLYNDRIKFLLMGETRQNGIITNHSKLFTQKFITNYEEMKLKMNHIEKNLEMWNNIEYDFGSDHFILSMDQKKKHRRTSFIEKESNISKLDNYKNEEKSNSLITNTAVLQLILFIFQYINAFEENSIKTNLWNYCLKSITFSSQCFFIGICVLIAQYTWIGSLLFNVISDFDISNDPNIILITIVTTLVSLLYSYISLSSFFNSIKLYKFLIKLYTDYPEIILSKDQKKNEFYKSKNITMKIWQIKFNFYVDFASNCILPILIPILNIFIIANSDSSVDAILNSVAIFFIIQIDEDLLALTEYEDEKNTIKFSKWIISSIYCKHFPVFTDIFKLEYNSWCTHVFNLSKRLKRNKISPTEIIKPNMLY